MEETAEEVSPELKNHIQSGPFYYGQSGTGSKTGMYFTLVKGFSRKKFKANSETVTKNVWKYPLSSSEFPHDGAFPNAGFPKIKPTIMTIQIDIAIPKVTL